MSALPRKTSETSFLAKFLSCCQTMKNGTLWADTWHGEIPGDES